MATESNIVGTSEKISELFQGMNLEEVASVLKIQLLMLVTQGAEDTDDAIDFLDEIHEDVAEKVKEFSFKEAAEDTAGNAVEP